MFWREAETLLWIHSLKFFCFYIPQNYWMPRFIIHCKLLFNKRSGRSSLKVYRPNFYVVEVQSLSEINLSKDEEQSSGSSNRSLTAKNVTLKRQYVSNLLSMFSSTTARHSEMSALINLEDTGETNIADAENQRHDSHSEHREWLVDEFPLLDISEESLVSSSRNSSAKTRHELSPLPIEYPPMTPSPEADSNKGKSSHLFIKHLNKKWRNRAESQWRYVHPAQCITLSWETKTYVMWLESVMQKHDAIPPPPSGHFHLLS